MERRSLRAASALASDHTSARVSCADVVARGKRRRWTSEQKRRIVAESMQPGVSPAMVAHKHGISTGQFYAWRQQLLLGGGLGTPVDTLPSPVPVGMTLTVRHPETAVPVPVATDLSAAPAAPEPPQPAGRIGVTAADAGPMHGNDDAGAAPAPAGNRRNADRGRIAARSDCGQAVERQDAAPQCEFAGALRRFRHVGRPGRPPVPGQQLLELMCLGTAADEPLQHVGEPGKRLDAVQLRRVDQGQCDSPVFGGAVRSGEQGIFPSYCHALHAPFDDVGVCALPRCTVLPGGNPGRQTLAPAGSTRSGPGGNEWSEALREKAP